MLQLVKNFRNTSLLDKFFAFGSPIVYPSALTLLAPDRPL